VVFQKGAMPRLRELWLESLFYVREARGIGSSDGGLDLGLGNLPSLQHFAAYLRCEGASKEEAQVELHHHVPLGHHQLDHPPRQVAGGAPEPARAADHRGLRVVVVDPDAAGHGEGAAAVRPRGERDGDGDGKHLLVLGGQHVGALRPADGPRAGVGLLRHHIVDRRRVAQVGAPLDVVRRPDAVDEVDGRHPRPAHHIVHVQPQVHRLRAAGLGGEQESHGGGEQESHGGGEQESRAGDGDELLCGGAGGHCESLELSELSRSTVLLIAGRSDRGDIK